MKWRWFRKDRPLDDVAQYDSASRGPLGSSTLLWRLGLRHPLASCGALITILMLVIDPFAQQIMRYRDCDVPIDGGFATVARTNYYQGHGSQVGIEDVTEPALQAAINAGIFSPGSLVRYVLTRLLTTMHRRPIPKPLNVASAMLTKFLKHSAEVVSQAIVPFLEDTARLDFAAAVLMLPSISAPITTKVTTAIRIPFSKSPCHPAVVSYRHKILGTCRLGLSPLCRMPLYSIL